MHRKIAAQESYISLVISLDKRFLCFITSWLHELNLYVLLFWPLAANKLMWKELGLFRVSYMIQKFCIEGT